MYLDNFSVSINLWWCPLGSDKPNHFVPLIESYKQVKCNGKRKRTSTETSIGTPSTSKYSQKSVSDYFEKSFEEVRRTCSSKKSLFKEKDILNKLDFLGFRM